MGLFGRKKNKAKAQAAQSSYSPPAAVASDTVAPDEDPDLVKVASVGREDSALGEAPEFVKSESMLSKASSKISAAIVSMKSSTFAEEENPYSEHEDGTEKNSVMGGIMDRVTALWAAVLMFWFSLSKVVQVSLLAGAAVGAVGVAAVVAAGGRTPAFPAHINVAFVGNSYFYVNDLPRFVEQIAGGHITQDSVIHNAASILQIIMTGNGMWHKWATKQAMINGVAFDTSWNTTEYLYDMGACSVPQLLTGHDEMVTYQNNLGSFLDDGQNPCFQQNAYLEHQESTDLKKSWDFVVITDQSKTMALDDSRHDALAAFNYTYGPILKKHHISPVIVQPHAYLSSGANATGLGDLTTFTALIMEGAEIYRKYINKRTGWFTKAHIAPVGNAFLAVYEESPYDLWPKLFLDDGIHPSAHGTFLYGCVIYATMTGYMPKHKRVVVDDMELSDIFSTARRLQASSSQSGFPTKNEADILYKIAKKVAVRGYKPKALRGFKLQSGDSDFLRSSGGSYNDNAYDGDYNGGQQYAYANQNNVYNQMYENQANNNNYYNNNGNYNYGNNNNGDNNNDNNNNDNNNNGNYNYGNNDYDYYEDNDEDDANGNDDNNGNYNANYNYGNNNNNQQNNGNNNNNQQYGGGNQNSNQYYYQDLKDDDNGN